MCRVLAVFFVNLMLSAQVPDVSKRDLKIADERTPGGGSARENNATAPPIRVPKGYAVVIGISDYRYLPPELDLKFGESDAKTIARTLMSKDAGNIEPKNIRLLIGSDATLAKIRAAIESWLPSVTQEEDRVVVYFVGHGVVDQNGPGYLAPYDIQAANLSESAYAMDQLGEVIGKIVKARWKVLLADACHSGKITPATSDEVVNTAFTRLPKNFLTLTSSREAERSFEDPSLAGGFGIFSYFVSKGWDGAADTDPLDGIVTADELIAYVRREVRSYARQQGVNQTPNERGDFDNDLLLGFSPTRRISADANLPELANGTLIIEVNLDNVEIYIEDRRVGVGSPNQSLRVPGLVSGAHTVKATRDGYEPAVPLRISVTGLIW